MHNNILDKGKQLARICSQERELYSKVLPVLKWIRTNIQNSKVEEMKVASVQIILELNLPVNVKFSHLH